MDSRLVDHKLDAKADALGLTQADVEGIFTASDVLASQYRLRSTLSDPAVPAEARAHVARTLLAEHTTANAAEVVAGAAELVTSFGELEASVERQGVRATFQLSGEVEQVQDEVFHFARILQANTDLQTTLTDPLVDLSAREKLVTDLLGERVRPATVALIKRAVQRRGRTLVKTLDEYVEIAAQISRETVAHVTVAQPLSESQLGALQDQLSRIYGVGIDIQVDVNQEVLGGVRIQVGDELIDGTILNRLNEARRLIG